MKNNSKLIGILLAAIMVAGVGIYVVPNYILPNSSASLPSPITIIPQGSTYTTNYSTESFFLVPSSTSGSGTTAAIYYTFGTEYYNFTTSEQITGSFNTISSSGASVALTIFTGSEFNDWLHGTYGPYGEVYGTGAVTNATINVFLAGPGVYYFILFCAYSPLHWSVITFTTALTATAIQN